MLLNINFYLSLDRKDEPCDRSPPLYGYLFKQDVHFVREVKGNYGDKWLIPPYHLDDEIPWFASGTGFLIPKWGFACMAQIIWETPMLFIDDMFTGGFLAEPCNITRIRPDIWIGDPALPADPDATLYHIGGDGTEAKYKYARGYKLFD